MCVTTAFDHFQNLMARLISMKNPSLGDEILIQLGRGGKYKNKMETHPDGDDRNPFPWKATAAAAGNSQSFDPEMKIKKMQIKCHACGCAMSQPYYNMVYTAAAATGDVPGSRESSIKHAIV